MNNEQQQEIQNRVHKALKEVDNFIKSRHELSNLNQRKKIMQINGDVKMLFIDSHIQSKGDIEKAFDYCGPSMIELQHKLIMMLSV